MRCSSTEVGALPRADFLRLLAKKDSELESQISGSQFPSLWTTRSIGNPSADGRLGLKETQECQQRF